MPFIVGVNKSHKLKIVFSNGQLKICASSGHSYLRNIAIYDSGGLKSNPPEPQTFMIRFLLSS